MHINTKTIHYLSLIHFVYIYFSSPLLCVYVLTHLCALDSSTSQFWRDPFSIESSIKPPYHLIDNCNGPLNIANGQCCKSGNGRCCKSDNEIKVYLKAQVPGYSLLTEESIRGTSGKFHFYYLFTVAYLNNVDPDYTLPKTAQIRIHNTFKGSLGIN